jgi:hypothetical protein
MRAGRNRHAFGRSTPRCEGSLDPSGSDSYIVDVEARQSLAVKARARVPHTFFQPDRFKRDATFDEKSALDQLAGPRTARNGSEAFLFDVAASAERAEVPARPIERRSTTGWSILDSSGSRP